ncbi:hypothetical protein Bbelb_323870 [Branchiostoma belcheri]|nr:hypothetical protein Bbelb_323870 [Branchiostoma belcheri]
MPSIIAHRRNTAARRPPVNDPASGLRGWEFESWLLSLTQHARWKWSQFNQQQEIADMVVVMFYAVRFRHDMPRGIVEAIYGPHTCLLAGCSRGLVEGALAWGHAGTSPELM